MSAPGPGLEARGAVAWGKHHDPPQGQGWYPVGQLPGDLTDDEAGDR